jgi:hypothetical protein
MKTTLLKFQSFQKLSFATKVYLQQKDFKATPFFLKKKQNFLEKFDKS